jgi:four helix bundle protein
LTMEAPLDQHFRLADQIRGAAISIPANVAEGYALSTTTQFIRCLRISLGSAAELRSHLALTHRLNLADQGRTAEAITLCMRVVAILVALLRKLGRNSKSRFPFPVSRIPYPAYAQRSSSIFVRKNTPAPAKNAPGSFQPRLP